MNDDILYFISRLGSIKNSFAESDNDDEDDEDEDEDDDDDDGDDQASKTGKTGSRVRTMISDDQGQIL